jgi:hypothetical protein
VAEIPETRTTVWVMGSKMGGSGCAVGTEGSADVGVGGSGKTTRDSGEERRRGRRRGEGTGDGCGFSDSTEARRLCTRDLGRR